MSNRCYVRCRECGSQAEDGVNNGEQALALLVDQATLLCLLFNHLEQAGFQCAEWSDTFGYSSNFHFALEHAAHCSLEVINEYGGVYGWVLNETKPRKGRRRPSTS